MWATVCGIPVHRFIGFRSPFLYQNVIFGKFENSQDRFWYWANRKFSLFLLFNGCAIEVTHVGLSTYISHFLTFFENFISCSREIWFCVVLELGNLHLRQYVRVVYQLNVKTGSVLPLLNNFSAFSVIHLFDCSDAIQEIAIFGLSMFKIQFYPSESLWGKSDFLQCCQVCFFYTNFMLWNI